MSTRPSPVATTRAVLHRARDARDGAPGRPVVEVVDQGERVAVAVVEAGQAAERQPGDVRRHRHLGRLGVGAGSRYGISSYALRSVAEQSGRTQFHVSLFSCRQHIGLLQHPKQLAQPRLTQPPVEKNSLDLLAPTMPVVPQKDSPDQGLPRHPELRCT